MNEYFVKFRRQSKWNQTIQCVSVLNAYNSSEFELVHSNSVTITYSFYFRTANEANKEELEIDFISHRYFGTELYDIVTLS